MAGSEFGELFHISTWGESHGKGLGVVIDGCPAGLPLTEDDFTDYMTRRRPNGGKMSTQRKEADQVEILSGTFEGKTTGTPISLLIRNTDQHSRDYSAIADIYRPAHADFGFDTKYGIRDYRGGGRSSGRETAGRVAAGAVSTKILDTLGITFSTRVTAIGGVPFEEAEDILAEARSRGDSLGSEVHCTVTGVPAGIGDPVFDKLDARLAEAIFSVGAVKALDIGDGRKVSSSCGSKNNDPFGIDGGTVAPKTNHAGGILGGISTGAPIELHVYFKPTPSISLPQETVNTSHDPVTISIHGRHDPVIGPRAAVVVEAMASLVILDEMMKNTTARLSSLTSFYCREKSPEE